MALLVLKSRSAWIRAMEQLPVSSQFGWVGGMLKKMPSSPAWAFASSIAALKVHSPAPVSQRPSPGFASPPSPVLLTVKANPNPFGGGAGKEAPPANPAANSAIRTDRARPTKSEALALRAVKIKPARGGSEAIVKCIEHLSFRTSGFIRGNPAERG